MNGECHYWQKFICTQIRSFVQLYTTLSNGSVELILNSSWQLYSAMESNLFLVFLLSFFLFKNAKGLFKYVNQWKITCVQYRNILNDTYVWFVKREIASWKWCLCCCPFVCVCLVYNCFHTYATVLTNCAAYNAKYVLKLLFYAACEMKTMMWSKKYMLYKCITFSYASERSKKVHLIISAHTQTRPCTLFVYTQNYPMCVCVLSIYRWMC